MWTRLTDGLGRPRLVPAEHLRASSQPPARTAAALPGCGLDPDRQPRDPVLGSAGRANVPPRHLDLGLEETHPSHWCRTLVVSVCGARPTSFLGWERLPR